jgi:hypothetical protein
MDLRVIIWLDHVAARVAAGRSPNGGAWILHAAAISTARFRLPIGCIIRGRHYQLAHLQEPRLGGRMVS